MAGSDSDGCKVTVPRWRSSVTRFVAKFKTRRSWVVIMFLLGTADMFMNLVNFIHMSDERLSYVLVIGPPTRNLWISMFVFTIVGTLFYFPETANTFSALYTAEGDTLLPLHLELVLTLLFEHIPLATVDYFVARSRRQYTTRVASWCHIVRLVFIFIRLVWYAHMEGKKLRKNDKHQIKQVLVLFCCLLYSVSIAFNIMNWRWEPDTRMKAYHLASVSIFMLKHRLPPEVRNFNEPLTDVLARQSGPDLTNAWLTDSLSKFFIGIGKLNFTTDIIGRYKCNVSEEFPAECVHAKWLSFRFIYSLSDWSPYGEIRYNFARVCNTSSETDLCVDSTDILQNGWKLFFYEAHTIMVDDRVVEVNVSAPFRRADTHPMPRYSDEVPVCRYLESINCDV